MHIFTEYICQVRLFSYLIDNHCLHGLTYTLARVNYYSMYFLKELVIVYYLPHNKYLIQKFRTILIIF